jgi:hypothetical protein
MTTNANGKSLFLTFLNALLLWTALVMVSPAKAFGYVDPGSGSFIYQAVYAAFLGGVYYFRRLLDKIWGRKRK